MQVIEYASEAQKYTDLKLRSKLITDKKETVELGLMRIPDVNRQQTMRDAGPIACSSASPFFKVVQ